MKNNNIFEEINLRADIISVAETYGFKIDRQKNIPCFIHNDKNPSLHLHTDSNTWWCYACGEGFTPIDFVMKLKNLSVIEAAKDLNFRLGLGIDFDKNFNADKEQKIKEGEYFYRRADGTVTMKIEKMVTKSTKKKEFFPYTLIDGEYKRGYKDYLKEEDCVLYNLPEIIKSKKVYFTEGEKDADTLKELGFAGTTTPGGGRGLKSYYQKNPQLFDVIKDKEIRIISDNDEVGNEYIKQVIENIKDKAKNIKIFNLCKVMPKLKEKGDISDVFCAVGKEKTLEFIEKLEKETEIWQEIEIRNENEYNINSVEDALNLKTMETLYRYELDTEKTEDFMKLKAEIVKICRKERMTRVFDQAYKKYKDSQENQFICDSNFITFEGLENNVYATNKYEMSPEGVIYEVVPNMGKILVCYHPIVPTKKYKSVEDLTEKVELAYYIDKQWKKITVDKDVISTSQGITKLSSIGIHATSENAKYLVKYLAEIENLNRNKIQTEESVSRLGWFNNKLVPYDDSYFLNYSGDVNNINLKFSEKGTLEEWRDFFKEKRKYNTGTRIIMAGAVASILLERIGQKGFTIHTWGKSGCGKTATFYAAESIFGRPGDKEDGIEINFNFTEAGLESRLDLYNNIPMFINEMQLRKDQQNFDKILFMVETGRGKSRSTKVGGLGKDTSWHNIALTNGEREILKYNSDNGAYNRCFSFEMTGKAYEDLVSIFDFTREHYGTAIREILDKIDDYDVRGIYEKKFKLTLDEEKITDKKKIIQAIILTGDKILTDIIFKDEYYLELEDLIQLENNLMDNDLDERAYELVKDWYISKRRCFIKDDDSNEPEKNVDIYGKEMAGFRFDGYVAFVVKNLREMLEDNGYDFVQVAGAWKEKGYTKCSENRNTWAVRINGRKMNCLVLNMNLNNLEDENIENDIMADETVDPDILPF